MISTSCYRSALATILYYPVLLSASPTTTDRSQGEFQAHVQAASQGLLREVEGLQQDIVAELRGRPERTLYRQADEVLERVVHFQQSVTAGVSRQQLDRDFNLMDLKLTALLKAVRALPAAWTTSTSACIGCSV
jgi:hypothetical protein